MSDLADLFLAISMTLLLPLSTTFLRLEGYHVNSCIFTANSKKTNTLKMQAPLPKRAHHKCKLDCERLFFCIFYERLALFSSFQPIIPTHKALGTQFLSIFAHSCILLMGLSSPSFFRITRRLIPTRPIRWCCPACSPCSPRLGRCSSPGACRSVR